MQQFFYDEQIRRFLLQFTRIFSNFQTEFGRDDDGNVTYIRVPIRYGDASKQAQVILQENSANNVPCAPLMSFYIDTLRYRRSDVQEPYFVDHKWIHQREWDENTESYKQIQGNAFNVERHMPVPYELGITLDIWTTNTTMKLQILEQILPLFNPALEIQNTDNYLDWTSLSAIEIKDTVWTSRSIPQGDATDIDISTLKFTLPIWITMPARVTKEGVIYKVINNIYDESGDYVDAIMGDDILLGTRVKVTPHGYQVLLIGNELQILRASNPSNVYNSSLDPIPTQDSEVNWHAVIDEYGKLRDGISLIRLQSEDESSEVVGNVSYHPTNDNVLIFNVDQDSIPGNTVAPVDAVINPLRSGPGAGLAPAATGQRYLLTEATGDNDSEYATAWAGTSGTELIANANDIIEYDGTKWFKSFDSDLVDTVEYVTNITTNIQYKWTTTEWVRSYEGIYTGGQWGLTL